ncbi:uncharacterized protein [Halyomorpha halys]|uniref:uncharacterized protein isoform X2 n=1 Tax=Halyomorpha halys TaxID=286706 RepID=UPI0006D5072F|nr:uncharacterized protein LOC106691438 isoform X2 [Halyomorpha halys]
MRILQCSLLVLLSILSLGLGEYETNNDQRTMMHFVRDPYFRINETSRNSYAMWYRSPMPNLNDIPREFKIPSGPKYFPEFTIGTEFKPKYIPKPARGKRSPGMKKHRGRFIFI